ncbi:MAG TPA: DUF1801 domain-containing protein [Candidatus Saccharimonadales bacterium]|nr:DUF1801 domain-containing protein [Candidatus Saccharimonadales bacterium]
MSAGKKTIVPGGVDEYIAKCPPEIQDKLQEIRTAIREVTPDAVETVSYFQFPGYGYIDKGYDYNGMFAWFSYKKPYIRLHVRPPVVDEHKKELEGCKLSKGAVSFPEERNISPELVKKMVTASLDVMRNKS